MKTYRSLKEFLNTLSDEQLDFGVTIQTPDNELIPVEFFNISDSVEDRVDPAHPILVCPIY